MRALTLLAISMLTVTTGCASLPRPTQTDADRARARDPEASLATLSEGRTVYVGKCAGCHNLKLPGSMQAKDWPKFLDEMVDEHEVELARAERQLIEQFLVTMADHRPE
jgi:cytochrome c5